MIHETAEVNSDIPSNVKIWHRSQVMKNVTIGNFTSIGRDVFIGHDTKIGKNCKIQNSCQIFGAIIGDNILLGPRCILVEDPTPRAFQNYHGNKSKEYLKDEKKLFEKKPVTILEGASIGAGAVIAPGITIGKYAMVSIGAVVVKDVPDYTLCLGNPARNISTVCKCGKKAQNCSL